MYSYPFATRISYLETCPFRSTLEAAFNNSSTSAAITFPFSNSMVLALCGYQKKHNLTQQEFSEGDFDLLMAHSALFARLAPSLRSADL